MRIQSLFLSVIILYIVNGCVTEPDYNRIYESSMIENLKYFPDTLLNHFPIAINTQFQITLTYPETCFENNRCGVTLVANYDVNSFKGIEEDLKSSDVLSFKYSDSCNLIVNTRKSEKDCIKYLETLFLSCKENATPIPNFPRILNEPRTLSEVDSIDISGFQIYVLATSKGVFIDESYLSNGWCLPNEWKNGLSKGIALNPDNNQVIYWLEIW